MFVPVPSTWFADTIFTINNVRIQQIQHIHYIFVQNASITDAAAVSPSIQKTPLLFSLEPVIKYKLSKRKRPEAKSEPCKLFWGTLSLALVFRGSFAGAFLRQFADRFTTLGAHHSSSEPHHQTDRQTLLVFLVSPAQPFANL